MIYFSSVSAPSLRDSSAKNLETHSIYSAAITLSPLQNYAHPISRLHLSFFRISLHKILFFPYVEISMRMGCWVLQGDATLSAVNRDWVARSGTFS
ncbi:MAG: hypothetical protein KDD67_11945 [Ignavibacteriae bacterium]|nr:hypothetical protein [Ignavibacteriota bacterium]MCB9214914.1 hypothetical protein [Ignavibacteria bacterium]